MHKSPFCILHAQMHTVLMSHICSCTQIYSLYAHLALEPCTGSFFTGLIGSDVSCVTCSWSSARERPMITSVLLLLFSRFFLMQFLPTHRYRYTDTHSWTHTDTHTSTYISRYSACTQTQTALDSIETDTCMHTHTNRHKTSDLCRGLSHISHFSQCCNCELFPSGLTHPKTSINRPSRSMFVCVYLCVCVRMCVTMGQTEQSLILQTSALSFN